MKAELNNSLYAAMEEANWLLHHVWIHVLGSQYHPQVKVFRYLSKDIEVEPDPAKWLPLPPIDWTSGGDDPGNMPEQREAFHALSLAEQVAVSDLRSREVSFTIMARKTDDLAAPELYSLDFTVYLSARAPAMEWRAQSTGDVSMTNVGTGEQRVLGSRWATADCMNMRFVPSTGKGTRFAHAFQYFA